MSFIVFLVQTFVEEKLGFAVSQGGYRHTDRELVATSYNSMLVYTKTSGFTPLQKMLPRHYLLVNFERVWNYLNKRCGLNQPLAVLMSARKLLLCNCFHIEHTILFVIFI